MEGKAYFIRNSLLAIPNNKERAIHSFMHRIFILLKYDLISTDFLIKILELRIYLQDLFQTLGRIVGYRRMIKKGD